MLVLLTWLSAIYHVTLGWILDRFGLLTTWPVRSTDVPFYYSPIYFAGPTIS